MPDPIRGRPAANVRPKADVDAPAPARGPARTDGTTPRPTMTDGVDAPRTTRAQGPYAALAARGDFKGYVRTASGQDVYVSIRLGVDAKKRPPVVFLDGLAARYERNQDFEKAVSSKGQTIISVFLPGQGETLKKDIDTTGGRSIASDISAESQAKVVAEVLDALQVTNEVSVLGLSYGGAIAAEFARLHDDRVKETMLVAPYTESQAKQYPWYNLINNPWNPWGRMWFEQSARTTLARSFPTPPTDLKEHKSEWHEGLYRLTMGLESFALDRAVKGREDVNFLIVPDDGASPERQNDAAHDRAKNATWTKAPDTLSGKHDLVRADPELVATWVTDVMSGAIDG